MEETPKALSNGSAKGDSAEVRGGDYDENDDDDDNDNDDYVVCAFFHSVIWLKWSLTPERIVRWRTVKHIQNRLDESYFLTITKLQVGVLALAQMAISH